MPVIPQGPTAPIYTLTANGVSLLQPPSGQKYGVDLDSIEINANTGNAVSTMTFTFNDPVRAFALPAGSEVVFTHLVGTATRLFGGFLVQRQIEPNAVGTGYVVRCTCVDYSSLLDRVTLEGTWKAPTTMTAFNLLLSTVLSYIGLPGYGVTFSFLDTTAFGNTATTPITFTNVTARQIVETFVERSKGIGFIAVGYRMGFDKVLKVAKQSQLVRTSPANVSDAASTPAGSQSYSGLSYEYDESSIINTVYIRGNSKTISASAGSGPSVLIYGTRKGIFDAPTAYNTTQALHQGKGFLFDHHLPALRGSFTVEGDKCMTGSTHWMPDDKFTLTNAALGLAAQANYASSVRTTFQGGNGVHRHEINFGGLPRSGLRSIVAALTNAGVGMSGSPGSPIPAQRLIGTP